MPRPPRPGTGHRGPSETHRRPSWSRVRQRAEPGRASDHDQVNARLIGLEPIGEAPERCHNDLPRQRGHQVMVALRTCKLRGSRGGMGTRLAAESTVRGPAYRGVAGCLPVARCPAGPAVAPPSVVSAMAGLGSLDRLTACPPVTSPSASEVSASGVPPFEESLIKAPRGLGKNTIVLSSAHAPPRGSSASPRVTAVAPLSATFLTLPAWKNAIDWPSGEKNRIEASSVPATGIPAAESQRDIRAPLGAETQQPVERATLVGRITLVGRRCSTGSRRELPPDQQCPPVRV